MDLESMSREDLVEALRGLLRVRDSADVDERERLVHELQVHQVELEMQNRELLDAQHALEDSRNRYADLYDFAPVAYFTLDRAGIVVEMNLTAAALIGREREKMVGLPLLRLIAFEDHRTFLRQLSTCLAGNEPVVAEFQLLARGRRIDVQATSVPTVSLVSDRGTVRTTLVDITRRKIAEFEREAALASEQRLRSVLEALDRAHVEMTHTLTCGDSPALPRVMHVIASHARSLSGARWSCIELDRALLQPGGLPAEPIQAGGLAPGERDGPRIELRLAYGERDLARLVVARAGPDAPFSGEERRALEMLAERMSSSLEIARLHAIDARDRLRLSLLERVSDRLRNVQEVASARSAVADTASALVPDFADVCLVHVVQEDRLSLLTVHHVDPGVQQLLSAQLRSPEIERALTRSLSALATSHEPQLLRSTAVETAEPRDGPARNLAQTLQTKALIVAPLWARDKRLGVMSFGRLQREDTYDLAMLSWAQEISDRCAAALDSSALLHELREAVRWRENLMATISHDLKSPLSAISLSAMSLAPEEPQVERRSSHRQVDLIRRSADHMHHMINDLLSASLLEAGSFRVELQRESARELAEEACQMAAPLLKARSLELERAFIADLPDVFADRDAIQRVFANLLGNAAKFTPQGGLVRVSASHSDTAVMFCVSDSGPGIPEDQQEHLFERYWKGRKGGGGFGLGLYIARAIIQAHEGRIWVENRAPLGATFCFELPRSDPAH